MWGCEDLFPFRVVLLADRMAKASVLDAIIIGAGPSGLGASIALSGYRPHYVPNCRLANSHLEKALKQHAGAALDLAAIRSAPPLTGRSNNPLALLFDALLHPGVDEGWRGAQPCLELRRHNDAALSHLILDHNPPGGQWHSMHDATRTLSPGPWMELPGYTLAQFLQEHRMETRQRDAASAAQMRQPRGLVADYYRKAAEHLGIATHHRPWRVTRVMAPANATDTWTVLADGSDAPLHARNLVLAVGTYGLPTQLGVVGEGLPFVAHRTAQLSPTAQTVLVVGAGLSAADCIVDLLRRGRTVIHVHRGAADATKLWKFSAPHSARMYPEYHALVTAMASTPTGETTPLLGGTYSVFGQTELTAIEQDGTCRVNVAAAAAAVVGQGVRANDAAGEAELSAEAIAILIGSSPDLSFLPSSVQEAIADAGPPSRVSERGVAATHKVFLDVEPFTMETRAVASLFALGPLRGDNFCRFAIHDGHGVAEAIRMRAAAVAVDEGTQAACPASADGGK